MNFSIANKFKTGVYKKPSFNHDEFYKGGLTSMQRRLKTSLALFHGAFDEFQARSEDLPNYEVVALMWEYVEIV